MSFTICCRVRRDKWRFFMPVLLRLISKTPYQSSTVASQAHRKLRHPWQYGVRPKTIRSQGESGHGPYGVGAIKGAIDNAELGNLTGLLAKIKPAVERRRTPAKGHRRITRLLMLSRARMWKSR